MLVYKWEGKEEYLVVRKGDSGVNIGGHYGSFIALHLLEQREIPVLTMSVSGELTDTLVSIPHSMTEEDLLPILPLVTEELDFFAYYDTKRSDLGVRFEPSATSLSDEVERIKREREAREKKEADEVSKVGRTIARLTKEEKGLFLAEVMKDLINSL